ncbi:MAG: hypothetical protein NVSMB22_17630 [Chloroflexota bacterium]
MGRAIKRAALGLWMAVACQLPLANAGAARSHASIFIPVLLYHHVKEIKPYDNAIERGLTIAPAQFESQLRYLRTHAYHSISASALAGNLRHGHHFASRSVVLTFDDGYIDNYFNVYPLLRRYKLVATFFIVPGFLSHSPRYMTWAQVRDMSSHGMDIEAHSMSHPDLTAVPRAQARGEVLDSRRLLERRLHRPVREFAYPYGAYNPSVLADVARAGYLAAFTTHQGWIARSNELLTLPRVYVDADDTTPIFVARLEANQRALMADPL